MRNGYSDEDNPFQQVYEYANLIREGKATDKHGVQILVDDNTPFYAYIICTITQKIRNFADMIPLTPSPVGDGYLGYNSRYKTYIEIISFQKLVSDAKNETLSFLTNLVSENSCVFDRVLPHENHLHH